jgi:hypothetical protein
MRLLFCASLLKDDMDAGSATPTDSGAATTGPTSFSDTSLTWTDSSSESTPSTETSEAASASVPTTEAPALTDPAEGSPQPGEPPQERWPDILENARAKAAEEAFKGYEWAKQTTPEQFSQMQQWYQQAAQDPVAFATSVIAELQAHPHYSQQLKSLAARTLSARGQQQAEMPAADVEIRDANGQVVGLTYSDKQLALRDQWQQQQWLKQVDERLAPLQQTAKAVELQRATEAADKFAGEVIGDLSKLPGFKEHAKEIRAELEKMTLPDDPRIVRMAAEAAYARVVPSRREQAQAQQTQQSAHASVLDELKRKAAASVSGVPSAATAASPKAVRSFNDPSLQW